MPSCQGSFKTDFKEGRVDPPKTPTKIRKISAHFKKSLCRRLLAQNPCQIQIFFHIFETEKPEKAAPLQKPKGGHVRWEPLRDFDI